MTDEGDDPAAQDRPVADASGLESSEPAPEDAQPEEDDLSPAADPEQAWKALALVNEWVRHAETKSIAALAASGVAGGFLFNLIKDARLECWARNVAAFAALLLVAAGSAAAVSLLPRLRVGRRRQTTTTSPLYFDDIARRFGDDEPRFTDLFSSLTSNYRELTEHIARQVHANAQVARRKYRWANVAILSLIAALLGIAVVAAALAN